MTIFKVLLILFIGIALASSRVLENKEEGKRLIKTSRERPGEWMTPQEIQNLIANQKTFIDITDRKYAAADPNKIQTTSIPTELKFKEEVESTKNKLNQQRIESFVETFNNYYTRYYASATGRSSQLWLLSQVEKSLESYTGSVSVREVNHGYLQRSIIARFDGTDPALRNEVVIFGAHLDSVNRFGASLQSPGADDNGSGSSVGLETLRVIAEEQIQFKRTVEFHWYAAEEIGLRGSEAIAGEYKAAGVNVAGMLNMDVVGYHTENRDNVGIYTDYGSPAMAQFLRLLARNYLDYGSEDLVCGYGCSDHASWTDAGFPAVMAGEVVDHPQMHTIYDNMENMDFKQVMEFTKLAVGFIIELGEPAIV